MRQRVKLHIDELVLEGLPLADRYRIGEALEKELSRLFEERGVPGSLTSNHEIESINGGFIEVQADTRAEGIGQQVARAVYGGLKR